MKLRYNTSAIRALDFHRDFWGWGLFFYSTMTNLTFYFSSSCLSKGYLMIWINSLMALVYSLLRALHTVLATIFGKKIIQILTTNIKRGLSVTAKSIPLKFIQLLTMPLILSRLTKPNWWIDQSACNTYFNVLGLIWVDNYLKLVKLWVVDELFALICLPHAPCFLLLVMLHSSKCSYIPRTQVPLSYCSPSLGALSSLLSLSFSLFLLVMNFGLLISTFLLRQNSNGLVLYLFILIPLEALLGRCSKKVIWCDPCYITFLEEHFES